MNKKVTLSKNKIEELRTELKRLKKEVFEHDKENAEGGTIQYSYNDATNAEIAIGSKRKRLMDLESILSKVKQLPRRIKSNVVTTGSWVELKDKKGIIRTLRIVHPIEADPSKFLISSECPLGNKLLGKKVNDKFTLNGNIYTLIKMK